MVKALHTVADGVLHVFNVLFASRHEQAVAHLQAQVAVGKEFYAVTGHAGDIDAVDRVEVELSERFAVDFRFGDDESARHIFGALHLRGPCLVAEFANERSNRFSFIFGTHHVNVHVFFQHRFGVRHDDVAILDAARNHEIAVEEASHLFQFAADDGLVRHVDDDVLWRGMRVVFLFSANLLLFSF